MKSNYSRFLRLIQSSLLLVLLAGCADLLQGPPEDVDPGDGRVLIIVGGGAERTVLPQVNQFSKIVLSFLRKDGAGTMSPVEVSLGETAISLSPGTWEVTASAHNGAETPVVVASAVNTLTRTGDQITGNTYFALAPVGDGPGFLRYTIAPPQSIALDAARSRIVIEKDGETLASLNSDSFSAGVRSLSGAIAGGTVSLEPGRYSADIVLDDNASIKTAVYREAVAILPGLVTEIAFEPDAADFLDPNARAALTAAGTVSFAKTVNDSSHTVIGTMGGGETNKTLTLSVHSGTETAYFTMRKHAQAQTITIGGAAAASVTKAETGTVDGSAASKTVAALTVNTAAIADSGGSLIFTLSLADAGKTPVVYTVTLAVASLSYLHVDSWPDKWVYLVGESFDPAGLALTGIYSDGQRKTANLQGVTADGFDSSAVGSKPIQIKKYGVTAKEYDKTGNEITISKVVNDKYTIGVISGMTLAFEPDIVADHGGRVGKSAVPTLFPPPSGYTVGPGQTLVLAPVKWLIPDTAVYEWKVDGVLQSSTTEYLPFAYSSFSAGNHTVTVAAKLNGTVVATATATVSCATGAVKREPTGASNAVATKLFTVVAPGQFGNTSSRIGTFNGAGGFGGYSVFKFDHSVAKAGVDGEEIKIGGNAFQGWNESGAIWVSRDENNNGQPDDAWYELKGSHTLAAGTERRYAVTFRNDHTWTDNLGNGGTYPTLQAYSGGAAPEITLAGTRLATATVSMGGNDVWGYADCFDNGRVSLSNAIQADGSSVDLPFIDFVKIVTAVHYAEPIFGERSTEAGTPTDRTLPNPDMLITGSGPDGNGDYNYAFTNNSGYPLAIVFDGAEFSLANGGTATKTSKNASLYIDFYGGNAEMSKSPGSVIFTAAPDS